MFAADEALPRERLPLAALLALAMTGFTAIMTETLPAGLLSEMASGLRVSEPLAGQVVTAYALGSLAAAVPLAALTRSLRRKPVMLAAIAGFLLFNTVAALSTSYPVALAGRFLAGVAAGLAWGLLAGYARRMVVDRLRARRSPSPWRARPSRCPLVSRPAPFSGRRWVGAPHS